MKRLWFLSSARFLLPAALVLLTAAPRFSEAQPSAPAVAPMPSATPPVTVRGYLRDAATNETLIGASVGVREKPGVGTVTNEYGFYSLSLSPGTYTLVLQNLGFARQERAVTLVTGVNQTLNVTLAGNAATQLQEVTVSSEREDRNVRSTEMGTMQLKAAELKKIPALLGEVDLVRAIQLMPGVQTAGEGTGGFYVRGGGVDQNLILLDEATVYNASHLLGFFSVFNADAIKDVQLIKGGIGAEYGGRLSSVLDIRMREGNARRVSGAGGIGSVASRLTLEGPLGKPHPPTPSPKGEGEPHDRLLPLARDTSGNAGLPAPHTSGGAEPLAHDTSSKAPLSFRSAAGGEASPGSWMIAGRRTYADVFFKLASDKNIRDTKLYFYDLNLKANYRLSDRDQLFVSGYFGRDVNGNGNFGFDWGNVTGTVRWNHLFSDRLFSNTTAVFSDFDYALGSTEKASEFKWTSHIRDYSVKQDFTYYLNPTNTLKFGAIGTLHRFQPGDIVPGPDSYINRIQIKSTDAAEAAVYAANQQQLSPRLTLAYGLRYSAYANIGPGKVYRYANAAANTPSDTVTYQTGEIIKYYGGLEPRLAGTYSLTETSSLKASYNRTRQYLHLLSNTTASLPFDVWTPATAALKPQIADQISTGYFRNFRDNTFEASVEVYYKWMQGQIDYKDNAQVLLNDRVERVILGGVGRSYGAEFLIRKQKGRATGWLSYTLSKTERQVAGINGGEWYPVRYDRRHNVALVTSYQVSPRLNLGGTWTYVTGGAVTMPVGKFEYEGVTFPLYSNRNGYRLPAYHRLDLAATLDNKPSRKPNGQPRAWQGSWTLSVYNAYNRHNAFSIAFREKKDSPGQTEAVKTYLFGILPSVTYNFTF